MYMYMYMDKIHCMYIYIYIYIHTCNTYAATYIFNHMVSSRPQAQVEEEALADWSAGVTSFFTGKVAVKIGIAWKIIGIW